MITSLALSLRKAEEAIQRGEYGQCITFLKKIAKEHPLDSKEGAEIRILMITAYMGKGEENEAIEICQILSKNKEANIRQQAKQLISILEAPSLSRPDNWSIKIPNMDSRPQKGISYIRGRGEKRAPHKQIPTSPPTGETKALSIGFLTVVVTALLLLTILLSN